MKKLIFIIFVCCASQGMSQISKSTQNLIRINGIAKVVDADSYFNVDTTMITIKLDINYNRSNQYQIIRTNKLGFADILIPNNKSIEDFIEILEHDTLVKEIIIITYGEYTYIPNDTYVSYQWYLSTINSYSAWDIETGNSNSNVLYPAYNEHVIAVGATNQNNERAYFSNYGSALDIVAPGMNIYSTTLQNNYAADQGTSFAAPIVAVSRINRFYAIFAADKITILTS